jgi:GT2 family glycosyltransferase
MLSRPKIVILGMMSLKPVAGVIWQTVHYLLGLQRLGCDVYYVESHARAPGTLMKPGDQDGADRAATFISRSLSRFGLGDKWAFHALHSDGRCLGMQPSELKRLYREADLIINLHGATQPLPEHYTAGRLLYLETDPVRLQIELHENRPETNDFLEPHCGFYTFGEAYGKPGCTLPVSSRFAFRPTRQPVVVDLWRAHGVPAGEAFTTVGNWRQRRRDVVFAENTYRWSKHHEFLKFITLPVASKSRFELALSRCDEADRSNLAKHGWTVRSAADLSADADTYQRYLCGSRAEFTVAKDQNIRMRTAWFSDRSASYLAAGRPVVTQDTGYDGILPTDAGLLPFSSVEEALSAVDAIETDYSKHSRAAAEIARQCFSHDVVLGPLLDDLGIERRTPRSQTPHAGPFPEDLVLAPESRRPLRLPEETIRAVLSRPLPPAAPAPAGTPRVSVVVVTYDRLVFTRLCLESLLMDGSAPQFEVMVVDNASTDGTQAYLLDLARHRPEVRPILNRANLGFAAANNQGIANSRGEILVLLNNDTIPITGWLPRLLRHLDDPNIGLVGPMTNRISNEAQIETSYTTLGQLRDFTDAPPILTTPAPFDIRMAAMFCVALRQEVFDRVGPLEERFGLGTLEDEDYAIRVREAGFRVVCARDAFVHHFGHASFDELVPSGQYHRLLTTNTRLFEQKWGVKWEPYARLPDVEYVEMTHRVRQLIHEVVPEHSTVAIVTKGDDRFLPNNGQRAWHFPSAPDGSYSGFHPSDDPDAIARLEDARNRGAEFLVIPKSAMWWLDHYKGFSDHLHNHCRPVIEDPETCSVYALTAEERSSFR